MIQKKIVRCTALLAMPAHWLQKHPVNEAIDTWTGHF
jgi:hypothetical protein